MPTATIVPASEAGQPAPAVMVPVVAGDPNHAHIPVAQLAVAEAVPVQATPAAVPVGVELRQQQRPVPPGCQPGGVWSTEGFIGTLNIVAFILMLFLFWPFAILVFLCPCESRMCLAFARACRMEAAYTSHVCHG